MIFLAVPLFTKEELFFITQDPGSVAIKLNELLSLSKGVVDYLGNRVYAENTNSTVCEVTGVNTTRGNATEVGEVTSDGVVTSAGTYVGAVDTEYIFEVVTACTAPGTITGMTFKWKKTGGVFSEPVEATGLAQAIESGLTIAFTVDAVEDFVVGDQWLVAVTTYKVSVATGNYLQAGVKKLLDVVTGLPVLAADTKVYITSAGAVDSSQVVPPGAVLLATIVNSAGTVTVTDARKYLV